MKIKSYKEQLWPGQEQQQNRFVLPDFHTNRHRTNRRLQYHFVISIEVTLRVQYEGGGISLMRFQWVFPNAK